MRSLPGLVAVLAGRVDGLGGGRTLGYGRGENAELRRRLGMDSGNSGTPPSKERSGQGARKASAGGPRGGGPRIAGREASKAMGPGWNPEGCPTGPNGLIRRPGAAVRGRSGPHRPVRLGWGQVWDILPVVMEKVHWELPRPRCGSCQKVTAAVPPYGQAGSVVYGPNINAAAFCSPARATCPSSGPRC